MLPSAAFSRRLADPGDRDVAIRVEPLLLVAGGPVLLAGHSHQEQYEHERERPAGKPQQNPGKVHP